MGTILFKRAIQVERATSKEELLSCFKLRYVYYCTGRDPILSPDDYPHRQEFDEYDSDERTIHVLVSIDEAPVGTGRIIFPRLDLKSSTLLFRMETGGDEYRLPNYIPRESTVEISRIAAPITQAIRISHYVYLSLIVTAMRMSLTHIVGITRPSFYESLKNAGVPHKPISESQEFFGRIFVPVVADLKPNLWKTFFDFMKYTHIQ